MEALDPQTGVGDVPMVEPEPTKAPALAAVPSMADLPAPDADGQKTTGGSFAHPAPQEEVVSSSYALTESLGSSRAALSSSK